MGLEAITVDAKSLFNGGLVEQLLTQAVNQTLKVIDSDFRKTTNSWKQQPEFTIKLARLQGGDLVGEVSTNDAIYLYVNNGTVAHDIRPRNAKKLHFMSGYRAKTSHRVIGSHAGGPSGSDVFSQGVHHPGTEAREFDKEIADRRQTDIERNCTAALLQAIKAAGR